jgi:hypothetical protein
VIEPIRPGLHCADMSRIVASLFIFFHGAIQRAAHREKLI